jgi:hypothetical protein
MHKSATKCNKTVGKWCKNKHGASKIIDTFETYHSNRSVSGSEKLSDTYLLVAPTRQSLTVPPVSKQWSTESNAGPTRQSLTVKMANICYEHFLEFQLRK